jgi:phage head maturation protease
MNRDLYIQGKATQFNKPFIYGDRVIYLKSGCLDASINSGADVALLIDHDKKNSLTTPDRSVEVYAGDDDLVFRYFLHKGSSDRTLAELADDFESYLAVSIGLKTTQVESVVIDGVQVDAVTKATLTEVSLLNDAPAVDSTYARIVSSGTCNSLEEDYERIRLVGRAVSLYRKLKSLDTGGVVKYSNATSDYERKASAFERALAKLQ